MFENSKQLDTLSSQLEVFYVKYTDFTESINSLYNHPEAVRLDLRHNHIIYSSFRKSILKDILHNWKFAYYLYRNLWLKNYGNSYAYPAESKKMDVYKIR